MTKDYNVVGLDIGTHYLKASMLSTKDENTLYGTLVESRGVSRDGVTDTVALGDSIKNVIKILENKVSRDINSVYINIPTEFARVTSARGSCAVKGDVVEETDIDRAIDMAQLIPLAPDEEIVDIIIPKYHIDDTAYRNPIGVKGSLLEIHAQVVVAKRAYVEALYEAATIARVRVIGTGLASESAASLLLARNDRLNGTFLVDTGANSSRVTLYKDDKILRTGTILLGGRNITKDLSIVLKISLLEAENLKKHFGAGTLTKEDERYDLVREVVMARMEEISGYIDAEMRKSPEYDDVDKVVWYGGGFCGFDDVKNLCGCTSNKSTNYMTSDIIMNNGIFTVQSSGIAYNVLHTIHYKKLLENDFSEDETQLSKSKGSFLKEEEFFEKHKYDFRKGYGKLTDEDERGTEDAEFEVSAEERVSIFDKIKNIFGK